jgi:uncharacterized protein
MHGIWRAAFEGDLAEVVRLGEQDPTLINAKDDNHTPLMRAVERRHVEVVRWLLDQGADVHDHTSAGRGTALWRASMGGCLALVDLLLERGADPTMATDWGSTPLMIASSERRLEVMLRLLRLPTARATINRRDHEGRTPLWLTCYRSMPDAARVLLEHGADPTIAANDGTTPMVVAKQTPPVPWFSAAGRRECVKALKVSGVGSLSPPPSFRHLLIPRGSWGGVTGVGAGLPAVQGPAGGRPAGERRIGGGGDRGRAIRGRGGGGEVRRAWAQGGPVPGPDGVHGVSDREGQGRGGSGLDD